VWTLGGCFVVFALSDVIVRMLYSSDFTPTVTPLRWLLPGIVALSVGRVLVAELMARTKILYMLWISLVSTGINIAGNLVLLPIMGTAGAALASTISYTLLSGLIVWCYLRETNVSWRVLMPKPSDALVYLIFG